MTIQNNLNALNSKKTTDQNVEVLYQKMGNRWFAFSVVGDDVFMGSISQEEIDRLEAKEASGTFAINGNS